MLRGDNSENEQMEGPSEGPERNVDDRTVAAESPPPTVQQLLRLMLPGTLQACDEAVRTVPAPSIPCPPSLDESNPAAQVQPAGAQQPLLAKKDFRDIRAESASRHLAQKQAASAGGALVPPRFSRHGGARGRYERYAAVLASFAAPAAESGLRGEEPLRIGAKAAAEDTIELSDSDSPQAIGNLPLPPCAQPLKVPSFGRRRPVVAPLQPRDVLHRSLAVSDEIVLDSDDDAAGCRAAASYRGEDIDNLNRDKVMEDSALGPDVAKGRVPNLRQRSTQQLGRPAAVEELLEDDVDDGSSDDSSVQGTEELHLIKQASFISLLV